MGWLSSPKPPPAPDYAGAAQATAAGNQALTTAQTYANRPDMATPWGNQNWTTSMTTDPATGQPVTKWSSSMDLTPDLKNAFESQGRVTSGRSEAAETLLGQATGAFERPVNWEGMPVAPTSIEGAQQGAFNKMSAMLQPGRQQQQEALEVQLANQGLPRNSEAWNRAASQLSNQWASQDKNILAQSLAEGRADTAAQYGIRQNAIAEEAFRRGMPLNELNALLSGQQVNLPTMPGFTGANRAQGADLLGAANMQGNYNLSGQGGTDWGSGIAGIASLAGTFFSDRRLKSDIVRVGTHPIGVGIYSFLMFGVRQIGVIAQELLGVRPDLVSVDSSGYLMVDYGRL